VCGGRWTIGGREGERGKGRRRRRRRRRRRKA